MAKVSALTFNLNPFNPSISVSIGQADLCYITSYYFLCSGPYTVRPQFQSRAANIKSTLSAEEIERRVLSIRINSRRVKEVKTTKAPPSMGVIVHQEDPFQYLAIRMSSSDISALKTRAESIVQQNSVQPGFGENHFLIKEGVGKYQSTQVFKNGKIQCGDTSDGGCIFYKRVSVCAHTVATSLYKDCLLLHLQQVVTKDVNLTSLTVPDTQDAGKKKPAKKNKRKTKGSVKAPAPKKSKLGTDSSEGSSNGSDDDEGDLLFTTQLATPSSGVKLTLRKQRKTKPTYSETTSTSFEFLKIRGNIRVCAGCCQPLKDGPDQNATKNDTLYCVRHKERDHVMIENGQYWKATFGNKHYHVSKDCILQRNPSFKLSELLIEQEFLAQKDIKKFLKKRCR